MIVDAFVAARAANDGAARAHWSGIAVESSTSRHMCRFAVRWLEAENAESRGDVSAAATMLAELAGVLEAPVTRTLVRLRRIELLCRVDRAAARAELESVLAFWAKAKAVWYLGELRRWANGRGLRVPEPNGLRAGQLLSEREREVARLVSEGLSNREIAERLIVSERTAEGHVQRILSKLNFQSRSQIATWYTEERLAPLRL